MQQKKENLEYTNSQMTNLIKEYLHNEIDQKILFLRLIKGRTIESISEAVGMDRKTVWKRIHRSEEILFRHLP